MKPKTIIFDYEHADKPLALAVQVDTYKNGNLFVALQVEENGYFAPFAFLTVNLGEQLEPNMAYVKTFDENTGLLDFILDNQLGELLPEVGRSGFCEYRKIAFDVEKLRELDPQGAEKHFGKEPEKTMPTGPISSSDPQAVEKLTLKLEACREKQTHMKAVNAYYRKHATCKGFPGMPDAQAAALDVRVEAAYSWDKQPYPQWELQNNNGEIRRLAQRIEQISQDRAVGFVGWEFPGGHAEANAEANRLQIFFDERPTPEQCTALKRNGFKWAPSQRAWQRQLNSNAIHAAGRLDFVKPSDGRTVRQHQPKAAPKPPDTGAK